jgi:hypothetical protein
VEITLFIPDKSVEELDPRRPFLSRPPLRKRLLGDAKVPGDFIGFQKLGDLAHNPQS